MLLPEQQLDVYHLKGEVNKEDCFQSIHCSYSTGRKLGAIVCN